MNKIDELVNAVVLNINQYPERWGIDGSGYQVVYRGPPSFADGISFYHEHAKWLSCGVRIELTCNQSKKLKNAGSIIIRKLEEKWAREAEAKRIGIIERVISVLRS